jgi:membrane-bound lytic murein transglycosylase B
VDLDRASSEYGVPASVIVSIIGIETLYGRDTGNFRVLDALATLGFRYPDESRPERSQLFRDQLADLIELHHHKILDALSVQGSYAGAMGLPQFMPGSLIRYAADGDKDGRIDLLSNPTDAIASVGRFLNLHGWVPGLPVFAPVILPADAGKLVAGGLSPTLDWAELRAQGASIRVRTLAPASGTEAATTKWQRHKVGVVDLLDEPRNLSEYRTATPNFFAITHYNRSYFYAAAVADLAQELADRMGYAAPNHPD